VIRQVKQKIELQLNTFREPPCSLALPLTRLR
jgi:hypothetical protein